MEAGLAVTFVLGGARSGKSAFAQAQAEAAHAADGGRLVMIATAQAFDAEMSARIARHRAERDGRWATVEAPVELAAAVRGLEAGDAAVVDCLTLWLSNLMLADGELEAASCDLLEALRGCRARLWVVSNEVGQGIVPDNALARRFRDEAGRLNQRIAAAADAAFLICAGLPLRLK